MPCVTRSNRSDACVRIPWTSTNGRHILKRKPSTSRRIGAVCLVVVVCSFALSKAAAAQSAPTVSWTCGESSIADCQLLAPQLYVTPRGAATSNAPVALSAPACSGTTAPFACSAPGPANALSAFSFDTKYELSMKSPSGQESGKSIPFIKPPSVPQSPRVDP